jgi:HTH-type transcriptional regulator/antitoxin HipB
MRKKAKKLEFELSRELVASKIKELRIEKNLTQTELGKLLGVQKTQISKLENNDVNITMATLHRVFSALGYSLQFHFHPQTNESTTA